MSLRASGRQHGARGSVQAFEDLLKIKLLLELATINVLLTQLRGKNLACWYSACG